MKKRIALPVLLALAGTASAQDRMAWQAAKPAGQPRSCLQLTQIRESRVRDDRTIDFYMRDGTVYRNVLPVSCPRLGFEKRFSYRTTNNQLCSVDIITVLYIAPPQPGPSCGLGQFQPVTGAGR